jgi:uncharacterized membrane protein
MTPAEPAAASSRLAYLDGVRGAALVAMVLNHTARWWMDGHMTWPRYRLIWITLTVAAPTFLFLVGFCLPLSVRAGPETLGALAAKLVPRGVRVIVYGLLLNLLVLRDEPILAGGVLQTIGLAIVAMTPALWLLRYRAAPVMLLALAVASYVAFSLAYPHLPDFVARHRLVGLVLFYDFPPWPWLSLVLIGLVLGWSWLQVHRRSPAAGARWLAALAGLGVVLLVAFVVYDWWAATPVRFGLARDFLLDRHRTVRGASLFWVFGILFVSLGAAYWVMEVRRWRLRWLVVLGRTALFLYFFHQLIVFTLVNQWLGWRFNAWPRFWLANAVLMIALIGVGWVWAEIRSPLRARLTRAWRAVRSSPTDGVLGARK